MGPYDFILLAGLCALCLLGLRVGGVVMALLAAVLMGCLALAFLLGTAEGLLGLLAVWFAIALGTVILLRRLQVTPVARGLSTVAVFLSAGAFAVIAIIVAGVLLSRFPDDGTPIRTATANPLIAQAGARLTTIDAGSTAQPVVMFDHPEPVAPELERMTVHTHPTARPIEWAEVTRFADRVTRVLAGSTVAADQAPVSFEVGGTVSRIEVDLGERFARGDVLAELDPTPLEIALDERRAALIEAEAVAREAELTLARQRQLQDSGTISKAALDSAEAAAQSARSRLAMTQASIRSAEDRLNDTLMIAPFDGVVAARLAEPAQSVQPGVPVLEIQDSNAGFQIEIIVPETLINQIRPGAEHAAVLLDGSDSPIMTRVHEIGSRANAATGFPVTLDIITRTVPGRAGMTAEVHLSLPMLSKPNGGGDLLAVPYTAILPTDGDAYVAFVFDPDSGTLARRDIIVSAREGTTALISGGLSPGDIVATRGLPFLTDGQAVALRGVGIARYD